MRQLDAPALLMQCQRILALWEQVAHDPARQDDYYARKFHHWQMGAPLPLEEVERWEAENRIELPSEYVYYLTQVGNGGACPGDCLPGFPPKPAPVPDCFKNDPAEVKRRVQANNELRFQEYLDSMRRPSEQLARIMDAEEWGAAFGRHKMQEDGTLSLCAVDLTYVAYLVVTGPQRGRVVYLDWDGDCAPMWAKGGETFLDWMENFYRDLSMGWTREGWQYMWQQPGDADALMEAFRREKGHDAARKEILYSFTKFPSLPEHAYRFLRGVRHPQFRQAVSDVLAHFRDKP